MGKQVINPSDRDVILAHGLAVVECSWARLEDVPFRKIASPHERLCESIVGILPSQLDIFPTRLSTLSRGYQSHQLW